jgi:hypothetical protein
VNGSAPWCHRPFIADCNKSGPLSWEVGHAILRHPGFVQRKPGRPTGAASAYEAALEFDPEHRGALDITAS